MKLRTGQRERVLLVGNGVNRLGPSGGGKSWADVLRHLAKLANMPEHERLEDKPFPLVFEGVFNRILAGKPAFKETQLKQTVAELVGDFPVNDCHRLLAGLPAAHILTTNYDHCLDRAIDPVAPAAHPIHPKSPSNFCLSLGYQFGERRVWHIHGDKNFPNSIMLGYDHYAGCLAELREALVRPGRGQPTPNQDARRLERKQAVEQRGRWIDIFLMADVDIIGFEFDLTESVLWWLLQFRHKCRLLRGTVTHPLDIGRIRFHDIHGPKPSTDKQKARNELLAWFGVEVVAYKEHDYAASYSDFADRYAAADPRAEGS